MRTSFAYPAAMTFATALATVAWASALDRLGVAADFLAPMAVLTLLLALVTIVVAAADWLQAKGTDVV